MKRYPIKDLLPTDSNPPYKRCEAGQTTEPTDCERHPTHHWCQWCEGWYGVTHDGFCHTAKIRTTSRKYVSPQPGCACRYCQACTVLDPEFVIRAMRGK